MKGKVGIKMKKIIALLLAITCAFALFACGETVCDTCVDANPKDAKCDVCGKAVACTECIDEDSDAECDVCGKEVECEECIDEDLDAECDVCGKEVECEECIDEDPKDAVCDVCGGDVACVTCVDVSPKNAKCDVCGKAIPCAECVDSNRDLKCDVCGGAVEAQLSPEEQKLADFVKRITSSDPTFIKTVTTYNDEINGNTLKGKYETTIYGENYKMYCEYERYAVPEAGADPDAYKTTVIATVFYSEGRYSVKEGLCDLDDMDKWGTSAPDISALYAKLDITLENLDGNYEFSYDGKTLTAELFDDSIKAVLGVDVDVLEDSALTLEIITDGNYLRNINITYQVDNGTRTPDTVSIQTSYTYGAVESPFEASPDPSAE